MAITCLYLVQDKFPLQLFFLFYISFMMCCSECDINQQFGKALIRDNQLIVSGYHDYFSFWFPAHSLNDVSHAFRYCVTIIRFHDNFDEAFTGFSNESNESPERMLHIKWRSIELPGWDYTICNSLLT